MNNLQKIEDLLKSLGYQTRMSSNYLSCNALYRGGDDVSSVVIYPELVKDFVTGETWSHENFIKLVTSIKTDEELKKYLESNDIVIQEPQERLIKQTKKFSDDLLLYIQPDHSYPISRGISEETCKLFGGGKVGFVKGSMKNRYVWVIRNSKNEIIGFEGRALEENPKRKYQHAGSVTEWVWPTFLNNDIIGRCKSVVITESPMDAMMLFDCGVKNIVCLFGANMSLAVLNYLLRRNVEKIILSLNNELESENGGVGNKSSIACQIRLKRYFDQRNIINFPPNQVKDGKILKDFNASDKSYIINDWFPKLKLIVGEKYFQY